MSEISMLWTELQNESIFNLFTKLLKKKIEGTMLSTDYLEDKEREAVDKVDFVECDIIFDCPYCDRTIHVNSNMQGFECDCGNIVNLKNIRTQPRYILSKMVYKILQDIFSQKIEYDSSTIRYIWGEKTVNLSKHDSDMYLHISPFLDTQDNIEFLCIDDAYVDHFIIRWKIFPDILNDEKREAILDKILQYRKEIIQKQLDWTKIDEWEFQNLVIEILKSENKFLNVIPGGKGADQGKDAIGYGAITLPTGISKEVTTLIQCKYTQKGQTFSTDEIQKYVMKSKRHGCNSLLFITNGYLSGDAVSEINSAAYIDKDFFGVDFWDEQRLFGLLDKHPIIRIQYFYR